MDNADNPVLFDQYSIAHVLGSASLYLFLASVCKEKKKEMAVLAFAISVFYECNDYYRAYIRPKDGKNSLDNSIADILCNAIGILSVIYLDIPVNYKTAIFLGILCILLLNLN